MSRRTDVELIGDILGAARKATAYVDGMSYAAFAADTRTQDAVIRNIEIIGEARLIHDYSGVNLDIVWQIAKEELPLILAVLGERA